MGEGSRGRGEDEACLIKRECLGPRSSLLLKETILSIRSCIYTCIVTAYNIRDRKVCVEQCLPNPICFHSR